MVKIATIILIIGFIVNYSAFNVKCGEALDNLIKYADDDEEKQDILEKETIIFEKLKKAIKYGYIEKELSAERIVTKYGKPIITIQEDEGIERWIYKPAHSTYFIGEKLYLYIDSENTLAGWKYIEEEPEEDK